MPDFEESYRRWRDAPFPSGSTNDAVDELHAQLAQWDAFVADEVIPVAEGHAHKPGIGSAYDIAKELELLRAGIEALAERVGPDDQALLRQYDDYVSLLTEVYSVALTRGTSRQ
jgi:hypothetical protein